MDLFIHYIGISMHVKFRGARALAIIMGRTAKENENKTITITINCCEGVVIHLLRTFSSFRKYLLHHGGHTISGTLKGSHKNMNNEMIGLFYDTCTKDQAPHTHSRSLTTNE